MEIHVRCLASSWMASGFQRTKEKILPDLRDDPNLDCQRSSEVTKNASKRSHNYSGLKSSSNLWCFSNKQKYWGLGTETTCRIYLGKLLADTPITSQVVFSRSMQACLSVRKSMKFKVASVQGGSLFQEGILMTSTQKAPKKLTAFWRIIFVSKKTIWPLFWLLNNFFFKFTTPPQTVFFFSVSILSATLLGFPHRLCGGSGEKFKV